MKVSEIIIEVYYQRANKHTQYDFEKRRYIKESKEKKVKKMKL